MNTKYIENLNEFVNWTTGENSATGVPVSGIDENNKISGRSIRELILNHLLVPFVTNEKDENKEKIYFFSSEYAKNLWKTYSDKSNPVLYDEEKAAELVLYSMDLPAVYKITGLDNIKGTRYIIEGNEDSPNAKIQFLLGIEDSLGSDQSDDISLRYTIKDESDNVLVSKPLTVAANRLGLTITLEVYQYLKPGRNKFNIEASCNNFSAKTSISFDIYLVTFSINSNFSGYYNALSSSSSSMQFALNINRSITSLNINTYIKIRDVENKTERDGIFTGGTTVDSYTGTESNFNRQLRLDIDANQLVPGRKYAMYIHSEMIDSESALTFKSNHLLYEFEIRTAEEENTKFINIAYSSSDQNWTASQNPSSAGSIILRGTLYMPFVSNWGYHTNIQNGESELNVQWYIRTGTEGYYTYTYLTTLYGVKGNKPDPLRFIPTISVNHETQNSFLVARINENGILVDVAEFPITIALKNLTISEADGSLKLSAYGKTNNSDTKNQWIDEANNVTTTFSASVPFDNNCGWVDNSLLLKGQDNYAVINYCPFPSTNGGLSYNVTSSGCAFQIDFKPEYVSNENDPIIIIGSLNLASPRIIITPTSALFYTGATSKIKTNFKSGERISLTFIINKIDETSNDSGLIYIVNNGILERAASVSATSIVDDLGNIKIGGSNNSVRIYSIRAYRTDIQVKLALANYMFDNADDAELLSRNDVYGNQNTILYDELLDKQDIILITSSTRDASGLTNILNNASTKQNATVNIERHSTDPSRNFTVTDCRIRNHGQSTLSYPITSMKMWFNKSNIEINNVELTPEFMCTEQTHLGLGKNRYIMKDGAIPANKFVLQANYADSSGAHNGSLLRLILDTWYNAQIKNELGQNEYKLRTAPLLFTSGVRITHNNEDLHENGSWVEGVYNIDSTARDKNNNLIYDSTKANKTWPELSGGVVFPYQIRVAADSFPCTVFYQEAGKEKLLLGLYVFMDDKKSDFCFGERSIYLTADKSDPFCLKTENSKLDKAANKVWDNENVLLVEVVYPNSPLTGYCSKQIAERYEVDPEDDTVIRPVGNTMHNFREIYKEGGNNISYYWEQHFELIYPDEDDLTGDKFNPNSDFAKKVEPFLSFLDWITDCKLNYNTATEWWLANEYSSTQEAFEATAHDHLDMYKLAAYYIFFLRFGLVDSVERNAQLKTYDGQHWHYEPWDMDIALGCANNGVIAYDPPLSRSTKKADGVSYVYSGRTASQSNTLWDCLENWDYWSDQLVPEVAQALYDAGLTYDNAVAMFDDNYVNKWAETLYNDSGHFKYIDAASDPYWMQYLNGARTSHRHWWLSKSMNYYDAKWACGDFIKHSIVFRMRKNAGSGSVKLVPNSVTFFKGEYGQIGTDQRNPFGDGLYEAFPGTGVSIPATNIVLDEKQQTFIFGANTIEELDMSDMLSASGSNLINIDLTGAYDKILGSPIKVLKLGSPTTPNIYTNPNENQYTSRLSIEQNGLAAVGTLDGISYDVLENTEHIDLIGFIGNNAASDTTKLSNMLSGQGYDRKNVKSLYALGCNLSDSFVSSLSGNKFTDLRLPDSVTEITMSNSSWEDISFWSTTQNLSNSTATYNKLSGIPSSINKVYFLGSTGKNRCSWTFIKNWILSIENDITTANPGATESEIEELLYTALSTKTLTVEQANWGTWNNDYITYKDIIRLSKFRNETGAYNLKGYVRMHLNDITSAQLVTLGNIYGPNVFNIGSTNTNLVIDNDSDLVRISSSDANVDQQTGIVNIIEGSHITLFANKFLLSADNIDSVIIPASFDPQHMENGKYYWGATASAYNHSDITTWKNFPPYVDMSINQLGRVILTANIGDGNDYTMYVGLFYKDENDNIQQDELRIDITAANYPSSYRVVINDRTSSNSEYPRQFVCSQAIANSIFSSTYSTYANELLPIYVMYSNNRKYEFAIEPVFASGVSESNRAPMVYKKYSVVCITTAGSYLQDTSHTELTGESNTRYLIGIDPYLKYTKDSVSDGISLVVNSLPENDNIAVYQVILKIKMGTELSEEITRKVNVMVINDSTPIISGSNSLASCVRDKYYTLYNSSVIDIYRSHLLGIYGELSFENYNTITSLATNVGDTILHYLPNVTTLTLRGCSSLDNPVLADPFDFSKMTSLLSLNIENCTSLTRDIDLTNYTNITSIDASGTSINVILPTTPAITKYELGTPTLISIINPTSIEPSGVVVDHSASITSLNLVNIPNNKTFAMFDKIMTTA